MRFVWWNCLIFLVGEYSSVWPEITRVFFTNSVETFTWNFWKKLFRENFQKFSRKLRLSSTKSCEILAYFLQFLYCVFIALKKFTQVLSYVVCAQVRSHVHKAMTKRIYGKEKPGRFVFEKLVLFTLGLVVTTNYSLGVFVWNFYQTSVTVSIEFWLRFDPQIRSTRVAINFLLITARAERKVRLGETVWFFSCVNIHQFDLKFVAFCPEFSGDSYVEFQ